MSHINWQILISTIPVFVSPFFTHKKSVSITTSGPWRGYDCHSGLSKWKSGWSSSKKDWCCTSVGICPTWWWWGCWMGGKHTGVWRCLKRWQMSANWNGNISCRMFVRWISSMHRDDVVEFRMVLTTKVHAWNATRAYSCLSKYTRFNIVCESNGSQHTYDTYIPLAFGSVRLLLPPTSHLYFFQEISNRTHWTDPKPEYLIALATCLGVVGKVPFNFWWIFSTVHILIQQGLFNRQRSEQPRCSLWHRLWEP